MSVLPLILRLALLIFMSLVLLKAEAPLWFVIAFPLIWLELIDLGIEAKRIRRKL